jgi:phosphoribosyl-ATP pyrophosphohydrolase/phosphoribosyl-AMP cyclohydrolase
MSAPETPASDAPTPAFDRAELLPAIVQDARTGQVLMLGYMNRESYARTLDEGVAWFFSRSRGRLWKKGETSGHVLNVRSVKLDCDGDTILVLADPVGPTCHTNAPSCFFTTIQEWDGAPTSAESAAELWQTIKGRFAERPEGSYIAKLAEGGTERIAKKVGEEAVEVAIAAVKGSREELTYETADLLFHTYVLLAQAGLSPDDVWAELARRRK